jgi:hypothetical protein
VQSAAAAQIRIEIGNIVGHQPGEDQLRLAISAAGVVPSELVAIAAELAPTLGAAGKIQVFAAPVSHGVALAARSDDLEPRRKSWLFTRANGAADRGMVFVAVIDID